MVATPWLLGAHTAHVHGVGELNIAVESSRIVLAFESPSESIYGFESEAKTAKQKKIKDEKLTILKTDMGKIFQIDADLKCDWKVEKVGVVQEGEVGHQNVRAEWIATCEKSPMGRSLKIDFGSSFSRLKSLKVNVLKDSGQKSTTLKSATGEIKF